ISPEYFGNLDAEHLKISQLTLDYNAYNDQITKNIETQIKLADLNNQIQKRLTFQNSFKDATDEFNKLIDSGKTFQQIIDETNIQINKGLSDQVNSKNPLTKPSQSYLD